MKRNPAAFLPEITAFSRRAGEMVSSFRQSPVVWLGHQKNGWQKSRIGRRGFTLVELLVYMVVASIVVMLAGRIFVDTMGFRVRTAERSEAITMAGEAMMYLEEDLRRVGAKAKKLDGSFAEIENTIYWNLGAGDSSSFFVGKNIGGAGLDSLAFRTALYDLVGDISGTALISYSVQSGQLWRRVVSGTSNTSTVIMDSVTRFSLDFGEYTTQAGHADQVLWNQTLTAGNLLRISGPGTITSPSAVPLVTIPDSSSRTIIQFVEGGGPRVFSLESGATYSVEIEVKPSLPTITAYASNLNAHLAAIAVRRASNGSIIPSIGDMIFYSGTAEEFRTRYFEFTHGEASTQAVHLFLHFQSLNHAWEIRQVRVRKINLAHLNWVASPTVAQKVRTRAIRVNLQVTRGPGNRRQQVQLERIIPTPNNGV